MFKSLLINFININILKKKKSHDNLNRGRRNILLRSRVHFLLKKKKTNTQEFPGSPMARAQHFHCCGLGSIPGWGTKIPQAVQRDRKTKQKQMQTHKNSYPIRNKLFLTQ